MTRVELIKNLSTIAPTYSIGQNSNSEKEYIVVKACTGYGAGSRAGFIQPYELLCYAPAESILYLDRLVENVKALMKQLDIEIDNDIGMDFYDEDIKMYMRYIRILIPEEV